MPIKQLKESRPRLSKNSPNSCEGGVGSFEGPMKESGDTEKFAEKGKA